MPEEVRRALDLTQPSAARRVLCQGPRGAGKSWWLDQAADAARRAGFTVVRAAGSASQADLALTGLATLLAPFAATIAELGEDGSALQRTLRGEGSAEPAAVKLATLRLLTTVADRSPLCLVVDDVDLLDSSSRDVLDAVLPRCIADPIVLLAAGASAAAIAADVAVRLEPLPDRAVVQVLLARGLAVSAATRCAAAAAGNPGVAVAMADALTDAQRAGTAPVPDLPKVGGHLAADLQTRMRALGEPCCRALVVAAAADGGDLGAVAGALTSLGEPGIDALEPAEDAGIVEIVGTAVTFPDQFVRHAAYYLLAPASRRAAHRALAASFTQPHQAGARVWHLVGAANGASDALSEALALVATDAQRRGATATAIRTFERAIEFAASAEVRERAVVAAVGAALDDGDLVHAARLLDGVAVVSDVLRAARAEVAELRTGRTDTTVVTDPAAAGGRADDEGPMRRLATRRAAWAAAEAGQHRDVLALLGERPRHPLDAVPLAVALRHAGRTREARDLLATIDPATGWEGSFMDRWWRVTLADLDVLAGREPDPTALAVPPNSPEPLRAAAAAVLARAALAAAPSLSPAQQPALWSADGPGPLTEVHRAVRAAVAAGDVASFRAAVELAERHRLPLEAGEARLWQAEAQRRAGDPAAAETVHLAQATLQRCGVRGWDARAAAVTAADAAAVPTRAPDPALAALSQAERRVVDAVAEGMTNREAAAALFLSVKTVDFHLQQIYRKLGVRSRTELAIRVAGSAPSVGVLPGDGGGARP